MARSCASQPREYEFAQLEALNLTRCTIDDIGFAPQPQSLQELNLSGTPIDDAALPALEKMPNLRRLDLTRTKVTGEGAAALQKALPKCRVLTGAAAK